jgi:CDGSH-type Zn-finger protein
MVDVLFVDKIEKYIDKDCLVHEGSYAKHHQVSVTASSRPCSVCSHLNPFTNKYCDLCSLQLSQIALCDGGRSQECPYPPGSHVLILNETTESLRPGTVKEVHRYGLYTIQMMDTGKVIRYLPEEMIRPVSAGDGGEEQRPNLVHHRRFQYVENAYAMLGAKIEARYHGGEIYYPGVVKGISADGLYEVEYDHGEVEVDVRDDDIIVIGIFCGSF